MFNVGSSRADITPPKRVFLAGFSRNRLSGGIHDRLYASVVSIRHGDRHLVFVSLDLIGLFKEFIDQVKSNIVKNHCLKPEEIIFCCTHTHSGPDTLGLWGPDEYASGVDSEYMDFLKLQIIDAVDAALRRERKSRAAYSWTWINPRGIVKNTRDKGLVDRYLSTLRFYDESGRTVAILVNFACHPEVLSDENKMITSDYVCYLRLKLEEKLEGTTIFLNGPLGGMLTPDVKARSFEEAERVGEKLANHILENLRFEKNVKEEEMVVLRRELTLPVENPFFLEAKRRGVLRRSIIEGKVVSEVCMAKVGEVSIAAMPGEALPRLGMEVRGSMNGKCKIIACLANDEIGYIIPIDAWASGGYEETMSLGPLTATLIQKEIRKMIMEFT